MCVTLIALTGGPGTGKTTLITELQKRGYNVIPEAARDLQRRIKQGSHPAPLPKEDPQGFNEALIHVMDEQLQRYDGALTFLDRSPLDILGYTAHFSVEPPTLAATLADKYRPSLGLFPDPLPTYVQDEERHESLEESLAIHGALKATYQSSGVQVRSVPFEPGSFKQSVEKRTNNLIRIVQEELSNSYD
jgi:predicted ATPase